MSGSVRLFRVARVKGFDRSVQSIAKLLRHLIVHTKPRNDGAFTAHRPIGPSTSTGGCETYDVLRSPVAARGNSIDDKLPAFSQVHDEWFGGGIYSYFSNPPAGNDLNISTYGASVQPIPSRPSKETA